MLGVDESLYFRCTIKGCLGRLRTTADYAAVEIRNDKHNHPPNHEVIKVREVVHSMREKAKESTDAICTIYRRCTATLATDPSAAAIMPSLQSVDSALYRQRHRLMPPLPQQRTDLKIPDMFKTTTAGEDFVLYQSDNSDVVIFCTVSNLKQLCNVKLVAIDGTFDASPLLYSQLFTLHAFQHDKLLPLVYCLLASKQRTAYAEVFQVLKTKAQQLNMVFAPETIMSDFETGMIAAVRDELPNAHHQGCYFHLTQVGYSFIPDYFFEAY